MSKTQCPIKKNAAHTEWSGIGQQADFFMLSKGFKAFSAPSASGICFLSYQNKSKRNHRPCSRLVAPESEAQGRNPRAGNLRIFGGLHAAHAHGT